MEGELFQGGVLMHSYLRAVGFSRITKRSSIRQIITDVVETYDEKTVIENYPDGMFAEFSKNYGCDCGITVCGQYDENNVFYPDYYFPFFRGTGITTQESVVIERHADKESFAGACDDLRIGVTLIFYLQNAAEYLQQREKGNILPGGQPLTLSGLAREGKILFPVEKDKEAVKAERELTKNRNHSCHELRRTAERIKRRTLRCHSIRNTGNQRTERFSASHLPHHTQQAGAGATKSERRE